MTAEQLKQLEDGFDKETFEQKRDQIFELTLYLAINHRKLAA